MTTTDGVATKGHLLLHAVCDSDLDLIKELIHQGVDIHINDDEPLLLAVVAYNFDIVKILVENGADIHAREDGAIHWAANSRLLRVFKYLYRNRKQDIDLDEYDLPDEFKERLKNLGSNKVYNLL